ncbi:MAG: phosphate signaling complex protein PhoU [Bacillota bacterium]
MKPPMNAYDRAILGLQKDLSEMGNKVKKNLELAVEALIFQDVNKAAQVIADDDIVDDMDYEIEYKALEIISLQQPLSEDLRILAGVLRIGKDLERIGDYAVNIAEVCQSLAGSGDYFKPLVDIPRMCQMAMEMLVNGLSALNNRDLKLAREVILADDAIDELYANLYRELVCYMKKDKAYVEQACHLAFVARYLERVGDHTVNIAEMTIYMVTGQRRPVISR